jgi:hypothetical protein
MSPWYWQGLIFKAAETAEKEWSAFLGERDTAINEVRDLRRRVFEEEARKQTEREAVKAEDDTDPSPVHNTEKTENSVPELSPSEPRMEVDETVTEDGHVPTSKQDGPKPDEPERKDDSTAMQADDEDAVEYWKWFTKVEISPPFFLSFSYFIILFLYAIIFLQHVHPVLCS